MNKPIKTVLGGVLFVAICIGLWNLFDFIWKTWINGSGYQFSSSYHILYPLGIGVVMYLILFVPARHWRCYVLDFICGQYRKK